MPRIGLRTLDLVAIAGSVIIGGAVAGYVAATIRAGGTRPISDCEKGCIDKFPNDTQARLDCMLKCIADGKIAIDRVLTLQ
jgi:hypothetical protein